MSKKKSKVTWWEEEFECPLFPVTIHVLVFKEIRDFKHYYLNLTKQQYLPDITNAWYAFAEDALDPHGHPHVFIVFPEDGNIRPDIWTHECVHGVNKIFKAVGQKLDLNNDEVQAYLTEFLFQKVAKCFQDKYKNDRRGRKKA